MLKMILAFFAHIFGFKSDVDDVSGPCFESLEPKTLMSAAPISVGVDAWGTLQVHGTERGDKVAIEVRGGPNGDVTSVTVGNMTSVFMDVKAMRVNLGAGKDNLKMSLIAPDQLVPITVNAGDGNDVIRFEAVGLSHDNSLRVYLNGDAGNDKIYVNSDTSVSVFGGVGRDFITTTQTLSFQVHHWFYGDAGNDRLVTHTGGYLSGGAGNDRLISKSMFGSTIVTGSGNDIAKGFGNHTSFRIEGSGNKKIVGGSGMDYVLVSIGPVWNGTFYEAGPPFTGKIVFNGMGGENYITVPTNFDQSQLQVKSAIIFTHDTNGGKG